MAPVIGFTFLLAVFMLGLFLPTFSFAQFRKSQHETHANDLNPLDKIGLTTSTLTLLCALIAQLSLIYSFIISDYSVKNVFQNSHHFKPLIYKISASWGNHEGSMLLLITILCGYNFIFNYFSKIEHQRKIIISSCQSFIIGLFAVFTVFSSNPFARIFPAPQSGLGLNPILQDIGLALHPPMLYTGYLGFAMIFSFAIAALLSEKINEEFAKSLKPWLFFAWGFLTLGIGLGAWWAYRELGWGGYWFWDPVENISLMPWLCATALIHSTKILEKNGTFKIWTIFLALLTFILCLLGIFLVRSGILTSVHSFAIDAKRGFFVIALIAIIGGAATLIFGIKINKISVKKEKLPLFSKLGFILFNNYFLLIALFVVLLGTIYPILLRSFFNEFITIGPQYYNGIFSLMIIPFLIFLALSNNLKYQNQSEYKNIVNRHNLLILLASLIISSLSFFYEKDVGFLQFIILTLAIFAAFNTILTRQNIIIKAAHLGFCLVIIGVILSSHFNLTKEVNLKIGQSIEINGYEIRFNKTENIAGANYIARQGDFTLLKNAKEITNLKPQLRFYPISNQATNESAIRHGVFGDTYIVIGNKDENQDFALRIYYKPFIYLIWAGCLLMFFAAMLLVVRALLFRT